MALDAPPYVFVEEGADALLPDIPAGLADSERCEVTGCDNPVVYGGKGRPPKRCPEHKGKRDAQVRPAAKPGATRNKVNEGPARRAAQSLSQYNSLIGTVLLLAPHPYGMPGTATAIAGASDAFEEAAFEALLTDPKLCAMINKAGAISGKFSLLLAYGFLAAAVAPVAIEEYKANNA